jgi:glycosyltransferase involved in cell wall biosynthesis
MMALRILVLSEKFPKPDFQSGDLRFVFLLELLARNHTVDFVAEYPDVDDPDGRRPEALRRIGVRVGATGWEGLTRSLARTAYHLVLFEFHWMFTRHAPLVRQRQPAAVLVIDSVDVHFARQEAALRLGMVASDVAATTRELELAAYRAAGAVIVVTPEDRQVLLQEGGMPPLFVVPNMHPIRDRPARPRQPDVLFVGGFRHEPNLDAVTWFTAEIWPRVIQELPTATFSIIGSNPPAEVTALSAVPGVRVLGYVPETAPFLDEAAVSVAPLRFGAGMKGKVNEAMAASVPVVSTTYGVQGIPVRNGVHAEIADDPEGFSRAVLKLLRDPNAADAMGRAGQDLAKRYSPDRVGDEVERMLRQLVPFRRAIGRRLRWLFASGRVALGAVGRRAAMFAKRS